MPQPPGITDSAPQPPGVAEFMQELDGVLELARARVEYLEGLKLALELGVDLPGRLADVHPEQRPRTFARRRGDRPELRVVGD